MIKGKPRVLSVLLALAARGQELRKREDRDTHIACDLDSIQTEENPRGTGAATINDHWWRPVGHKARARPVRQLAVHGAHERPRG